MCIRDRVIDNMTEKEQRNFVELKSNKELRQIKRQKLIKIDGMENGRKLSFVFPDGTAHLFWMSANYPTDRDRLYYRRYCPDNKIFTDPQVIADDIRTSDKGLDGQMSEDGQHIVVVHEGHAQTGINVLIVESFYCRSSWTNSSEVRRLNRSEDVVMPLVALEDTGRVFVCFDRKTSRRHLHYFWQYFPYISLYHERSIDGGKTWFARKSLV
eukprot:TRINITY_DN9665_c0_g1_i3.p1 TRINITY_DN9665_c0_g1~~TRINITY_DN9665_c0_g1_i3.p1  ORF type:complete len:212 (-),score=25.87 TRINITY_DN9665_c0_g1_i3:611-1246(-)